MSKIHLLSTLLLIGCFFLISTARAQSYADTGKYFTSFDQTKIYYEALSGKDVPELQDMVASVTKRGLDRQPRPSTAGTTFYIAQSTGQG